MIEWILRFCLATFLVQPSFAAEVGYFSPSGVSELFASDVDIATINASGSPAEVALSFEVAAAAGLKINLDLSPLITDIRPPTTLETEYVGQAARERQKVFAARDDNKLRDFLPDAKIRDLLGAYLAAIKPHSGALYSVFLIDEPYLNGVSRGELERVGRLVGEIFEQQGLPRPKLGVLFASAMFNSDFAERTQRAALAYAERIDRHFKAEQLRVAGLDGEQRDAAEADFLAWQDAIETFRLTTYDSAGNLYTEGGIPEGFDIVAFDFYLSTYLFDELYEDALSWIAIETGTEHCKGFDNSRASAIRTEMSFFQDGPMTTGDGFRDEDDAMLDRLYACRNGGVLALLNAQLDAQAVDFRREVTRVFH